uniref:Retroviral polymerase SH3-like domain-containing protein n=1 Tax=Strigamia maritima TaxID=126957 RepID=T1ITS7_STRMM
MIFSYIDLDSTLSQFVGIKEKNGQLYHVVSNIRGDPGLNETLIPDKNETVKIYAMITPQDRITERRVVDAEIERVKKLKPALKPSGKEDPEKVLLWHRRFSHYNLIDLIRTSRKEIVLDIPRLVGKPERCDACSINSNKQNITTLLNGSRCCLNYAKLGNEFWEEVAHTVCHTMNRIARRDIDKISFELFYGNKPSVKHLRVFGSLVYAKIAQKNRAKAGILVGYSTKTRGYRVYIPEEGKVWDTSNVVIEEQKLGSDCILDPNVRKVSEFVDFRIDDKKDQDYYDEQPPFGLQEVIEELEVKTPDFQQRILTEEEMDAACEREKLEEELERQMNVPVTPDNVQPSTSGDESFESPMGLVRRDSAVHPIREFFDPEMVEQHFTPELPSIKTAIKPLTSTSRIVQKVDTSRRKLKFSKRCVDMAWYRIAVLRRGTNRYDIYHETEGTKKLRSENEVKGYCTANNIQYDSEFFDFSTYNGYSDQVYIGEAVEMARYNSDDDEDVLYEQGVICD